MKLQWSTLDDGIDVVLTEGLARLEFALIGRVARGDAEILRVSEGTAEQSAQWLRARPRNGHTRVLEETILSPLA